MAERLYYQNSFLYEFDAEVVDVAATSDSRSSVILDRTAFYPTSGGQVFDTGWICPQEAIGTKLRVIEVMETDDGQILHVLENLPSLAKGAHVHGLIDIERRRDHMQQHSGQHVLSAAFLRLFNMPTVSFHMGAESCSIDLDTKNLNAAQVESAEALANDVVMENRAVSIRFVTQEEARGLGLRKIPPVERDQLRLIEVNDFDVTACGGTHVSSTGQIGSILVRKTEKTRQGWRVEFVCGKRAVATARHDYTVLAESAGLLSSHVWDTAQQIRKIQDESRASRREREHLMEEFADLYAKRLLAESAEYGGRKFIVCVFPDRDLTFIKLLGQRLTRQSAGVVAFLGVTCWSARVSLCSVPGAAVRYGSTHERNTCATRRARRWQ